MAEKIGEFVAVEDYPALTVRGAKPTDEDNLRRLFAQGMVDAHKGQPEHLVKVAQQFTAYNLQHDFADIALNYCTEGLRAAFLVAEINDVIVGGVGIHPVTIGDAAYAKTLTDEARQQICELRRMTVSEVHRKKGIATTLIQRFEVKARELGYNRIHLTTGKCMIAACRLYEGAGFIKIEDGMAQDYPYCRYVKDL
mmetsp:Transcript_44183/g.47863  ORF Transcript_44183/g.47863 Transcript_44183/m.47863 type:complete len:196 (+) Transcript_44183:116-703(+)